MNTYDYEDALFRIDPNLRDFRDLKEKYVQFNSRNGGNPIKARAGLCELISEFSRTRYEMLKYYHHVVSWHFPYISA